MKNKKIKFSKEMNEPPAQIKHNTMKWRPLVMYGDENCEICEGKGMIRIDTMATNEFGKRFPHTIFVDCSCVEDKNE